MSVTFNQLPLVPNQKQPDRNPRKIDVDLTRGTVVPHMKNLEYIHHGVSASSGKKKETTSDGLQTTSEALGGMKSRLQYLVVEDHATSCAGNQ